MVQKMVEILFIHKIDWILWDEFGERVLYGISENERKFPNA